MKKTLVRIASFLGTALLAWGIAGLTSCKSDPEDLKLFGEWEEKGYPSYDTLASFSQHRLILDCAREVKTVSETPVKEGEFSLYIKSTHLPSYSSDKKYTYMEFVRGTYQMDEMHKTLSFDGTYYTDSLFQTVATDSNTNYGFGKYQRKTAYQVNDISLTLSLDDSTRSDINTFYPISLKSNCF